MPRITAPLLSFGSRGQIGKSMVFSTWKGIPYARQYVVPANPRTTKQTNNRGIWAMLNSAWLYAPAEIKGAFNAFAVGKALTGRNQFFKVNQKLLAVDPTPATVTDFIFSPGNGGGIPGSSIIVTPDDGELVVSATLPDVPEDWTLVKAIAAAFEQQDPVDPFSGKWFVATDAVTPADVIITGLTNGTLYVVGYFLEWTKPDGKTAYSISLYGTGTPAV